MFDRPKTGERALLVLAGASAEDPAVREELHELALSAGAEPIGWLQSKRDQPDPKSFIGSGKLEELKALVAGTEAELVLFNNPLTPSQERNLERSLEVRVIDRTGLILDIFAQRAQSYEGKLQVELAQLRHLSTRLVRGWTHLERQKGGIGLRGPGETQLETDKRLIGRRIAQIQKRLDKVDRQRDQGRRARRRSETPVVGLVGYTNAGKSTLINALTGANVYAADQLFATLDPTLRRYRLGEGGATVILADTVGFVRDLPHELVAAFKSTLKETVEADLLFHVVDASDEGVDDKIFEVERVIEEIGADEVPRMRIMNKIDRLEARAPQWVRDEAGEDVEVWVAAQTGAGLTLIDQVLKERLGLETVVRQLELTPSEGGVRAKLYGVATVLEDEALDTGGWRMRVQATPDRLRFLDGRARSV